MFVSLHIEIKKQSITNNTKTIWVMLYVFFFLGFELLLCGFLVIWFTYAHEMEYKTLFLSKNLETSDKELLKDNELKEYKTLCKYDNLAIGFVVSGLVTLVACSLYVYITISA